ncbi:MAG TPA: SGNH/GDSL hydrolase family protein [Microbacterium sp.]|uniref:SGNH/GDSL hydrolase family protein n=1 Tax=Microbacterium sp. TaxID=51671 RepID=UPI002C072F70|nr:SGNH/GDSL hydrolase family protein [Microbacterium sp.]HWI31133.1 SGNH/GDSL hydrolase family protein [Microbacterium sp.]
MTSPDHPRRARRAWPLVAVAVAVALVCAFAASRPWVDVPDTAATVDVAADENAAAAVAPAALALPEHARVLIFGDSWTYGSAASAPELGYAYAIGRNLGWETIVDGVRGSGYLKPGFGGGTFGQRIAALDPALDPDLVIVQGSINDRAAGEVGYRDAVTAAWDALAALYPGASFVILGPAPHVLPVGTETARIDRDLGELAATRGWWYVSPVEEEWITAANYASVIDSTIGRSHPSTAGHAYLASRLAQDLAGLSQTSDAAADVPVELTPDGETLDDGHADDETPVDQTPGEQ